MKSSICHKIKYNKLGNDCILTPPDLAKSLIKMADIAEGDVLYDPFAGKGAKAFYDNYPDENVKYYSEITEGLDFFEFEKEVDWIITNPPYSILDPILEYSAVICRKGFAYLLGFNNLTAKRIEDCNKRGFYLSKMHICKVMSYFGMSAFWVFERGTKEKNILSYDRTVWKDANWDSKKKKK